MDIAFSLGCELLVKICTVLISDVLDNGIPATIVIDQIAIAGSVDDVQP